MIIECFAILSSAKIHKYFFWAREKPKKSCQTPVFSSKSLPARPLPTLVLAFSLRSEAAYQPHDLSQDIHENHNVALLHPDRVESA